jgi:hypothetical protein
VESSPPPAGPRLVYPRQLRVLDLVPGGVRRDERLDRRRRGQREEGADQASHRPACQRRAQRDAGVQVHRLLAQPGFEQVVLELLVDHDPRQQDRRASGTGRGQGDDDRHDPGQVGPDDRDERRREPGEDGQGHRERDAGQEHDDEHQRAVDHRQQDALV